MSWPIRFRPKLSGSPIGKAKFGQPGIEARATKYLRALRQRHADVVLHEIAPVLGVLLAMLVIGLWANGEYRAQKAEVRLAETERYIAEFESAEVAEAWRRLSGAWQAERPRQQVLLSRLAELSGAEQEAQRTHYWHFVIETIDEYALQADIETVLVFFRRLALCVRAGSCDRTAAAGYFGQAVRWFHDQHEHYFELEYPGSRFKAILEIAPADTLFDAQLP